MKLTITTPLAMIVQQDGVTTLTAEDASGSFGIQPHHADFLTRLSIGVVRWCGSDAAQHACAVRGGVLTVTSGQDIAIATREAVMGDDSDTLENTVLTRLQADADADRAGRVDSTRLQLTAIRQIVSHLHAGRGGTMS